MGLRRNSFDHDYPDARTREAALQQAFESIPVLAVTLGNCADWLNARFGLELPKISMG